MTVEHFYDPADGFRRIMPSLRHEDIAAGSSRPVYAARHQGRRREGR